MDILNIVNFCKRINCKARFSGVKIALLLFAIVFMYASCDSEANRLKAQAKADEAAAKLIAAENVRRQDSLRLAREEEARRQDSLQRAAEEARVRDSIQKEEERERAERARIQMEHDRRRAREAAVRTIIDMMIFVEGGSFEMGCTREQRRTCADNEKPPHGVNVGNFFISKHPVTRGQWNAVMGDALSGTVADNLPVVDVSWNDVHNFIRELNAMTNRRYRVPTEAEWEFAARGGNRGGRNRFAGGNRIDDVAWYSANSNGVLRPVMGKNPNELGLFDMSGNVFEWVSGRYGLYQQEPASGTVRILRGCGFASDANDCRVSSRHQAEMNYRRNDVGVRLALSP